MSADICWLYCERAVYTSAFMNIYKAATNLMMMMIMIMMIISTSCYHRVWKAVELKSMVDTELQKA